MISDTVWTAILTSLPMTIAAIATLVVAIRTGRKVEQVHIATNSMKDALVAKTEKEALARGIKQGTAEEKAKNE